MQHQRYWAVAPSRAVSLFSSVAMIYPLINNIIHNKLFHPLLQLLQSVVLRSYSWGVSRSGFRTINRKGAKGVRSAIILLSASIL